MMPGRARVHYQADDIWNDSKDGSGLGMGCKGMAIKESLDLERTTERETSCRYSYGGGNSISKLNPSKDESQKKTLFLPRLGPSRRKCSWLSFRHEVKDLRWKSDFSVKLPLQVDQQ